jgi:copper chaperone CopZ
LRNETKNAFSSVKEVSGYSDSLYRADACISNVCTHFFPDLEKQTINTARTNIQTVEFSISGMACSACEAHVRYEVGKLTGIIMTTVSYEDGNAIIEFDQSRTDMKELEFAIAETGYSVAEKKEIQ